jgi:hypothetical protein
MPALPLNERARDCLAICLASLAFVVMLRPFQNTPFVDDWVYAWSVENLITHGRLQILNFSDNVNVAQILWGAIACLPLGFSFTALRVSTWLLGLAALCGLYLLARELDAPRRDALVGTATLAVYPVFTLLSVTFMTDVPFLGVAMLASAAMVRALRTHSTRWLVTASLLTCIAVAVRAVGIVLPCAMLLALVARRDAWGRRWRWLMAMPPLLLFALLYALRSSVFHGGDVGWIPAYTMPYRLALLSRFALSILPRMLAESLATVIGVAGIALLPIAIACVTRRNLWRTLAIGLALGLALAGAYASGVRYRLPLAPGSMWSFTELGATASLVPDYTDTTLPAFLPWMALALAVLSVAAVASAACERGRLPTGVSFVTWSLLGHFGTMALIWLVYDRYALVLVPYAIALCLAARTQLHTARAVASLAVAALTGAMGLADHLQYNRALWDAVGVFERAGVPVREINGGYVVNGWLQYAHPQRAYRNALGQADVPWVSSKGDPPYRIANRSISGWEVMARFPYDGWLQSPGAIYALKRPLLAARPLKAALGDPSRATPIQRSRTGLVPPRTPPRAASPSLKTGPRRRPSGFL